MRLNVDWPIGLTVRASHCDLLWVQAGDIMMVRQETECYFQKFKQYIPHSSCLEILSSAILSDVIWSKKVVLESRIVKTNFVANVCLCSWDFSSWRASTDNDICGYTCIYTRNQPILEHYQQDLWKLYPAFNHQSAPPVHGFKTRIILVKIIWILNRYMHGLVRDCRNSIASTMRSRCAKIKSAFGPVQTWWWSSAFFFQICVRGGSARFYTALSDMWVLYVYPAVRHLFVVMEISQINEHFKDYQTSRPFIPRKPTEAHRIH